MAVNTLPIPGVIDTTAGTGTRGPAAGRFTGRLTGRRSGRLGRLWPALGPAFVAAVAYVDPGNFATNLQGGATYGYGLVWVVVAANLIAMLVQYLSAKIGVVTGAGLAEACRDRFPRAVTAGLWLQAELVVMATDLAEFVGTAIALQLLFGLLPVASAVATTVVASAVLALRSAGRRRFEVAIVGLLLIVLAGFTYQLLIAPIDPLAAAGGLVPGFDDTGAVLLACGIVGATVMPHAVYLHSSLAGALPAEHQDPGRPAAAPIPGVVRMDRRRLLQGQRVDVITALCIAGCVNVSMLLVAGSVLHGSGLDVSSLPLARDGLAQTLGPAAGLMFAVALLASGLSSSAVGTCAGDMVMSGFLRRRLPTLVRRTVTMAPAFIVLAVGADPTMVLVLSQVVLSFGIPFTLIPLVLLTSSRAVMGPFVNRWMTITAATLATALIIGLNGFLIAQLAGI